MATCKLCGQECIIELDPDDYDEATSSAVGGPQLSVPDDIALVCQCHFHWQCLLDESMDILANGMPKCPHCGGTIASNGQILTFYLNEGGLQCDLDILPAIREEAYLIGNPNHRPARAFLTMCAEGDVSGMAQLVEDLTESDDPESMSAMDLVRYQDPLDGDKTGLHIAVERQQIDAVFLMLWLGSHLPDAEFTPLADPYITRVSRASAVGLDIRNIFDAQGRSAAAVIVEPGIGFESYERWLMPS